MALLELNNVDRPQLSKFGNSRSRFLHQNITNQILTDIRQGQLKLGDKLPSQSELVNRYKVSVATVRQSLMLLEKRGVIRKEMGRGSFVSLQASSFKADETQLRTVGLITEVTGDLSDKSAERQVLMSFANVCQPMGVRLMVAQTKLDAHLGGKKLIETFEGISLDGVCIFLHIDKGASERIKIIGDEFKAGVVLLPGKAAENMPIDCTDVDLLPGMVQLMEYLISLGHRRIAYIGPLIKDCLAGESWKSGGRWQAYTGVLERAGIAVDKGLLVETPYGEDIYKQADTILDLVKGANPVTAVFAANDWLARQILNIFWKAGVRVPQDVSLAGLDNIDVSEQMVPALTTVAFPFAKAAETVIELIQNRLSDPKKAVRHVTLNTQLIVRDSVRAVGY